MARKKRSIQQPLPPTADDQKAQPRYQDPLQQNLNRRIDEVGKKFEGKGRTVLYAIGAVVVLALIVGIFVMSSRRKAAEAQTALGKAIETSEAQISETGPPAGGPQQKTFKTEKERAEAAIAEFQAVAEKFGGAVGDKAKYFAAVNKLVVDRAAAITELDALVKSGGDVGTLSKFALAQAKAGDGNGDEAAAIYKELAGAAGSIISKDTINFALAAIYEKQGKKQEAAQLYFEIASAASNAKDKDGKAIPMGQTAREAKAKVEELDPEKAKEIKEPELDPSALGGMRFPG